MEYNFFVKAVEDIFEVNLILPTSVHEFYMKQFSHSKSNKAILLSHILRLLPFD